MIKRSRVIVGAFALIAGALMLVGLLYSCGGGGASSDTGTVALYVTDDIADYQQVSATINSVQLRHTGTGAVCDVFTGPLTVDLTNLDGVLQLIDVTACRAVPYNRIHIEFAKSVELTSAAGSSACSFTSYLDDHLKPNALSCGADTCTLDINGAVNVLVKGYHKLVLDFDLKRFTVSGFGTPSCQVTMKVSPLHVSGMTGAKHLEAVTGLVSGLNTTDRKFTLTRGKTSFSVLYSGITGSQQPGIDMLLQRAQDDRLRVRVMAADIDCVAKTITATAVFLKVEGRLEPGSLDTTARTFSVVYSSGTVTRTIAVDYRAAVVEGTLAEGAWIDVKLYGYDGAAFLAWKVEVEGNGWCKED
jgi:hypothetical protein